MSTITVEEHNTIVQKLVLERDAARARLALAEGLLGEALHEWSDEHGGDHHEDDCRICRLCARIDAALATDKVDDWQQRACENIQAVMDTGKVETPTCPQSNEPCDTSDCCYGDTDAPPTEAEVEDDIRNLEMPPNIAGRYRRLRAHAKSLGAELRGSSGANAMLRTKVSQLRYSFAEAERARDAAEKNYRFMVERAADEKLDGYRELGERAATAENERDQLRAENAQLRGQLAANGLTRDLLAEERGKLLLWLKEVVGLLQDEMDHTEKLGFKPKTSWQLVPEIRRVIQPAIAEEK